MEFLGIGYQEMLLVFVLLLVVVGPERLPTMAYQIGRAVRTMQRYARAVRDEFKDEFDYVEEQVKVVRGEVDTARSVIKEQSREFNAEMRALDAQLSTSDLPPLLPSATPTNGTDTASPVSNPPFESPIAAFEPKPEPTPAPPPAESGKPPLVF